MSIKEPCILKNLKRKTKANMLDFSYLVSKVSKEYIDYYQN